MRRINFESKFPLILVRRRETDRNGSTFPFLPPSFLSLSLFLVFRLFSLTPKREKEREIQFFPQKSHIKIELYSILVSAFRGMGDTEKEGNNYDQADRDESEATSCARGWRGGGRFRAPCHHQHDRGRRATGAHHAGSKSMH